MEPRPVGYVALLRRNRAFRRLWYGQVTSQLGDWLDSIALYTLLLRLTGSGAAVGALLVAQFLPSALVALGAGVVVDRFRRRHVMIAADLGCAALVLLFLLVRTADQIWIIYAATVLKMSLVSFFEPAREAVIPYVASREELVAANGVSGLTWSVMLTGGAALGGVVTGTLGTEAAFVLDSVSFLVSAAWTWAVPINETHMEGRMNAHPVHDFLEGFRYLLAHGDVAVYTLSKLFWSIGGGGVLLLLTLFGKDIFPLGKDGALSIGLLYAARGVGAGIGPVLAQRVGGASVPFLRRSLGIGFFLMAAGYLLFSRAPSLGVAAAALVLGHIGGSIQWVFSTTLLQLTVPHRLQGRVFAVELALFALATSASSYVVGVVADAGWPPRTLARVLAVLFVPPGIFLTLRLWRRPRPGEDERGPEAATGSV